MMRAPTEKKYTAEQIANGTAPSGAITLDGTFYPSYGLSYRSCLTQVFFPKLTSASKYVVSHNSELTAVIAQKAESITEAAFSYNSKLQCVDVLGSSFGSLALAMNPNLSTLIIRNPNGVSYTSVNTMNGTATAAKPVHVYVPRAVKTAYEDSGTNGNWAGLLNAGSVVFHSLEGSVYEDLNWWRN